MIKFAGNSLTTALVEALLLFLSQIKTKHRCTIKEINNFIYYFRVSFFGGMAISMDSSLFNQR